MQAQIIRKMFLGFIHIHILYHAKKEPFYGAWMIEELNEHGYSMSPGTLYPLLNNLEQDGLLSKTSQVIEGKRRYYYSITPLGNDVLEEGIKRATELVNEIKE